MNVAPSPFDFERMATLAKDDPIAFLRHREDIIRRAIDASQHSRSLEELQMFLDADRYCRPSGGIASSEALLGMMIDSIDGMEEAIKQLSDLVTAMTRTDRA